MSKAVGLVSVCVRQQCGTYSSPHHVGLDVLKMEGMPAGLRCKPVALVCIINPFSKLERVNLMKGKCVHIDW